MPTYDELAISNDDASMFAFCSEVASRFFVEELSFLATIKVKLVDGEKLTPVEHSQLCLVYWRGIARAPAGN